MMGRNMKKGMNTFIGLIDKYLFLCFNLIKNKYMKLLELILDWKMDWFSLIFSGSIFNAIALLVSAEILSGSISKTLFDRIILFEKFPN